MIELPGRSPGSSMRKRRCLARRRGCSGQRLPRHLRLPDRGAQHAL